MRENSCMYFGALLIPDGRSPRSLSYEVSSPQKMSEFTRKRLTCTLILEYSKELQIESDGMNFLCPNPDNNPLELIPFHRDS